MADLGYPALHYLNSARGWLELGSPHEAARELAGLPPEVASHPDTLELRWSIRAAKKEWASALDLALDLVRAAPDRPTGYINRSFALHELGRTPEALSRLLEAVRRFPEVSVIPYNCACYACRLEKFDEARRWLQRAIAAGNKEEIQRLALKDTDLKEMWPEIRRW